MNTVKSKTLKPQRPSRVLLQRVLSQRCDWYLTNTRKCKNYATHQVLCEWWTHNRPMCAEHAKQSKAVGFQIKKLANDKVSDPAL